MNKFKSFNNNFGKIFLQKQNFLFLRAGEAWRNEQGRGRSGNEDGVLHDIPDWRFADGREAPLTPNQARWVKSRKSLKNKLEKMFNEADEYKQKESENVKQFERSKRRQK